MMCHYVLNTLPLDDMEIVLEFLVNRLTPKATPSDGPNLEKKALKEVKKGAKVEPQQGKQQPLQGRANWVPRPAFEDDSE